MPSPRALAALAAAVVLAVLPVTAVRATAGDEGHRPGKITGFDGLTYDNAPFVVEGLNGELFLGPDFDVACATGARYDRALDTFAKVARIIARSGRTVVFTAAPNKSSVFPERLDTANLPHGQCDLAGIAAHNRVLMSYDDPNYLGLLGALRRTPHQAYWKTDPHWSSVGGSVFAKQLAAHLDPRLGRIQRYEYGSEEGVGMLTVELGEDTPETLETAFPAARVKVRNGRHCKRWAGYPTLIYDTCWVSSPAKRTWPGRTLLLGDSFMMYALENLRPLFRQGTFMWLGHSESSVAREVRRSDTVVLEVAQLFVPGSIIATKSFRKELKRVLL